MLNRLKIRSGRPLQSYSRWDSRPCGLVKDSNNFLIPPEITLNDILPAGLCASSFVFFLSFFHTPTRENFFLNLLFKKYFMVPHYCQAKHHSWHKCSLRFGPFTPPVGSLQLNSYIYLSHILQYQRLIEYIPNTPQCLAHISQSLNICCIEISCIEISYSHPSLAFLYVFNHHQ